MRKLRLRGEKRLQLVTQSSCGLRTFNTEPTSYSTWSVLFPFHCSVISGDTFLFPSLFFFLWVKNIPSLSVQCPPQVQESGVKAFPEPSPAPPWLCSPCHKPLIHTHLLPIPWAFHGSSSLWAFGNAVPSASTFSPFPLPEVIFKTQLSCNLLRQIVHSLTYMWSLKQSDS